MLPVPRIENVVATLTLDISDNFRLKDIAAKCGNSEYNPRRFNGAIMRLKNPKNTSMIFSNGKVVMVGLRSEHEAHLCSRKIIKKLHKFGMCRLNPRQEYCINNVVASVATRFRLNLESMNINENAQYEPDTFPGLIFRMKKPKSTFLVFSNGKVVINGVKSEAQIHEAFTMFYHIMKKYRIFPKEQKKFYDRKQFILI